MIKVKEFLLGLLAVVYAGLSQIYGLLFSLRILKAYRPKTKTIVVGNMTYGGTGKTPVVLDLIKHFSEKNLKVVVVSRSYKGKVLTPTKVETVKETASFWGDEAFLIATTFPKVPVIVCRKKAEGVKFAEQNFQCDIIIVDDGLQHRWLDGHFYLTLLDASQKIETYRWAPLGHRRESWWGLKRSHAVLLTKVNLGTAETKQFLLGKSASLPTFEVHYVVSGITNLKGHQQQEDWSKPAVVVAGIGNPASFLELLKNFMGHQNFTKYIFGDHANYSDEIVRQIESSSNGRVIYTTAKDAVKILPLAKSEYWRQVQLGLDIKEKGKLYALVDEVLRSSRI